MKFLKNLGNFEISGTAEGSDNLLKLDEISIVAEPEAIRLLGVFFINAAYEMDMDGIEHIHLQDQIKKFSYKKYADIIAINKKQIIQNKKRAR